MGQLESLRELNITESTIKKIKKKKKKRKEKYANVVHSNGKFSEA
jgi:hypothetical protein